MKLADWLTETEMTAAAFAVLVGVAPSTVTHWTRGAQPRTGMLRIIAYITAGEVQPNDFAGVGDDVGIRGTHMAARRPRAGVADSAAAVRAKGKR